MRRCCRLRVRPFRVTENVQVCYRKVKHEIVRLAEQFLGFSRKSNDDIRTDTGIRNRISDTFDSRPIEIARIAPAHSPKDHITPGLERNMPVAAQLRLHEPEFK